MKLIATRTSAIKNAALCKTHRATLLDTPRAPMCVTSPRETAARDDARFAMRCIRASTQSLVCTRATTPAHEREMQASRPPWRPRSRFITGASGNACREWIGRRHRSSIGVGGLKFGSVWLEQAAVRESTQATQAQSEHHQWHRRQIVTADSVWTNWPTCKKRHRCPLLPRPPTGKHRSSKANKTTKPKTRPGTQMRLKPRHPLETRVTLKPRRPPETLAKPRRPSPVLSPG